MYAPECRYVHYMCVGAHRGQKKCMICLLELELQMTVSYHVVLGTKLEYSARGLRDLTHRATLSLSFGLGTY